MAESMKPAAIVAGTNSACTWSVEPLEVMGPLRHVKPLELVGEQSELLNPLHHRAVDMYGR